MDLADYVLQRFSQDDKDVISAIVKRAGEAAIDIIENDMESAMRKYNIRTVEK